MDRLSSFSNISTRDREGNLGRPRVPTGSSFLREVVTMMGTTITFGRDDEVFGEGELADYVYLVVQGSVRNYKLLSDGRRQIASFALPGDVFGLDAVETYGFSAEAMQKSDIVVAKRSVILLIALRDGAFATELWQASGKALAKAQSRLLLLGRKNARERVAAFLMEMAERTGDDETINLPMSRLDIADYLGLTIETVSRTISCMEHDATIALPKRRRIEIGDTVALRRLNA